MFIHNSTFMVEARRGGEALEWLVPLARKAAGETPSRISVMRRAAGADAADGQAMSVAFQVEFATMAEAEAWETGRLKALAAAFSRRFASEGMLFSSIFETV